VPDDFQPQDILVTGGAGFIGCALSHLLAPKARSYVVLDNLHPQVHAAPVRPAALHEAARLVVGDVTAEGDWDRLFAQWKPGVVVHLAAETGTGQSLTQASRHSLVNVVGTTRLTDALGRHGIHPSRILLTSSRAVYGEGAWRSADGALHYPGQRSHEQLVRGEWDFPGLTYQRAAAARTAPAPVSVYGATKLAQEHVLGAWCAAVGVPLTVVRLQNVYGPGQSLSNPYTGIVSLFSRLARQGSSIPLYEDGQVTRDFVHIGDVAAAIRAALLAPAQPVLDIGSGVTTTLAEMAGMLAHRYRAPEPHVCGKFRDGDVRHASCDLSPTLARIEWTPKWPLAEGLESVQSWIQEQLSAAP
jgi:dTDP-L-rhamnose 4-epimerase